METIIYIVLVVGIVGGGLLFFFRVYNQTRDDFNAKLHTKQTELDEERNRRIRAESELQLRKTMSEEKETDMQKTFDAMATKTMENSNKLFLQLAEQTMEKYIAKASTDMEKQQEAVQNMVYPLKQSLNKHENLIKELENSNSKIYGSLRNHLEELSKSQHSLQRETNALVTALKSPRVRGRWGEIGLRRIVEFSGLSAYCDFEEQVNVSTEDGSLRPDMLVNLPGNKQIVVDSKVPLNAYLDALETDDAEQQKVLIARHAKAIETHLKQLASKSYWAQFDNSVDFVVLYIEVEPAFASALTENKQLMTDALSNRIVFATPTTLIALLQTVAYTWKQHKVTENAIEIWHTANEFYERLSTFTTHLDKIGTQLNTLTKTYNQAVGSWEGRVIPGIRKMENMGVSSSKKEINPLNEVDTQTRQLKTK